MQHQTSSPFPALNLVASRFCPWSIEFGGHMKIEQSERGLFERGFDDDLPQERLERILGLFPTSDTVTDLLLEFRELDSFTDMKRGELYPEVIGGVTRLRRTIASVYDIDMIQSQPNFS